MKELFKFDKPLEVYSTNYDTCIEQLCYVNHRLYTDGFDINWNEHNFSVFHDIKHFKLHGSVIWYQNLITKECIKIPVNAFREDEPLDLRLIYGESVKPLLIYPAQKAEYVEPLTDLQLMFKHRLFAGTKFVIVVGYSFRDDYIVHMLWDASRANDELTLILINPNAQDLFESKIRYTDSTKKSESRISERTICLPYPFAPLLNQLKNNYLRSIEYISTLEKQYLESESKGDVNIPWGYLLTNCIDGEFIGKAEWVLEEKIRRNWNSIEFSPPQNRLIYSFKALLHSSICGDEYESRWLSRLNETFEMFSAQNLRVEQSTLPMQLGFGDGTFGYGIRKVLDEWIKPLINERRRILQLLTTKFEDRLGRLSNSLSKLDSFSNYLELTSKGINWQNYKDHENDSEEIRAAKNRLKPSFYDHYIHFESGEPDSIILKIERENLRKLFDGDTLQFSLH